MAATKATRKKTTARKAARAKTTRKKATRKKTTRKKTTRKKAPRGANWRARLESELPKSLRDFSRSVSRDLARLERQIESGRKDARRRWTRLVRDASHLLGRVEAEGQQRWRSLSGRARRDVEEVVRRIRRAID